MPDKIITSPSNPAYRDGWDRIFGKKKTVPEFLVPVMCAVHGTALNPDCLVCSQAYRMNVKAQKQLMKNRKRKISHD